MFRLISWRKYSVLTHSLTHSLTHLLTHSLTHSLTHPLTYSLTHLLTHLLTHFLPYYILISILKDDFIPNKFKAPVCRILRCMYVDREPQVAVHYPRLVRTFCKIGSKGNAKEETDDHNSSPYMFAVLQTVISDYLSNDLNLLKYVTFLSAFNSLTYLLTHSLTHYHRHSLTHSIII